jgi:hypothetical protein
MVKGLAAYAAVAEDVGLDLVNPFGDTILDEVRNALRGSKLRMASVNLATLLQVSYPGISLCPSS